MQKPLCLSYDGTLSGASRFTSYMYKFGSCILLTQLHLWASCTAGAEAGTDVRAGPEVRQAAETHSGRTGTGASPKRRDFADLVCFTTGGALPGGALQRFQGEGWRLQAEWVQQPLAVPTHQAASCQHHNQRSGPRRHPAAAIAAAAAAAAAAPAPGSSSSSSSSTSTSKRCGSVDKAEPTAAAAVVNIRRQQQQP